MITLNNSDTIICNGIENNDMDKFSENSDVHERSIFLKRIRELPELTLRFHHFNLSNLQFRIQQLFQHAHQLNILIDIFLYHGILQK